MSKSLKGYAAPLQGKLAGQPMKIISNQNGFYQLQQPSTGYVFGYSKHELRACKRKEIEAARPPR